MSTPPTTHCKRGHERTPENTYKDGRCRVCHRMRERVRQGAVRAAGRTPRDPKTHCKRGHARTPDNLTKSRQCRACRQEQSRAYYLASKGETAPAPAPERPIRVDPIRHACNVRGVIHYIERRRQRLARQARQTIAA